MVKASIDKYEGKLYPLNDEVTNNPNQTSEIKSNISNISNHGYLSNDPQEAKVLIAMTLSLFTGILHVMFFSKF